MVSNTTYYNLTSRVLRNDGGLTNYLDFNHNTVVNTGQRFGELGEVLEAHVTNNVIINTGFLGLGPTDTNWVMSADTLGSDVMGEQVINVRNNNISSISRSWMPVRTA